MNKTYDGQYQGFDSDIVERLRKYERIEANIAVCDFLQGKLDDPHKKAREALRTLDRIRDIVLYD